MIFGRILEGVGRDFGTRDDNKWPGKPPETYKPSATLLKNLGKVASVFTNYFNRIKKDDL